MNEYWVILRRRRLWILACVAGGVAFAVLLNEITTPVYRSSVRVEVQRESTRSPLTGAQTESPTAQSDNQTLFTTAQLVTSREPMAQVVEAVERKGIRLGAPPRRKLPGFGSLSAERLPATTAEKVDWLLAHVTVEPLRDTRLIRISVENSEPAAAAAIANTVAETFVRYHLGQRSAADNTIAAYLRSQAAEVSAKIQSLEQKTGGSDRLGLFALEAKIQQLTATIRELNDSYSKTTTERLALASQLGRIRRVSRDPKIDPNEIPIRTDALDGLRRELLASNTALAKAREVYGSSHPKLIMLQSENDQIRRNVRDELAAAVGSLENQRSIVVGREVSLQMAIGEAEDELRGLNDQASRYSSVEAELKTNRELHNLLMSRVHEAEIAGQLTRPLVRTVEPASTDLRAVRPRKLLNLVVGFLLGALSGAGLAFLSESFRKTIRTPRDVDEALQLPVLGLIPKDAIR